MSPTFTLLFYAKTLVLSAALKEQWAEGQEREVKLPEEELETVTTYFQWLYGDTVATKVANEDKQDAYVYLAKLYGLGERLLDSKFQNRIVDAFLVNSRELMNGERYSPIGKAVNIIYENTPKSSPARQLMVEYWYCQGGSKWVEESKVQLHHEFMEDMLSVLLSGRERPAVGGARYNALREGVPDAYYKHD